MQGQVHNSWVKFRVSDALVAKAALKAQREGMSLSELMRHALRKEVRGIA